MPTSISDPVLFCFGYGYVAQHLSDVWRTQTSGSVFGTTRHVDASNDTHCFSFSDTQLLDADALNVLERASAVLISIPPSESVHHPDRVARFYGAILACLPHLRWVGYCSTTGVYGDTDGAWVDESAPTDPNDVLAQRRLAAEHVWLELWQKYNLPLHILRLSGIYGRGRSALDRARQGDVPVIKQDHVMNRIHVADIVQAIMRSIAQPRNGAIYNLSDDCPAASSDVLIHAYELLGLPCPMVQHYTQADLSPMAQRFYESCRRVDGGLVQQELGFTWNYPDYKTGLQALLGEG